MIEPTTMLIVRPSSDARELPAAAAVGVAGLTVGLETEDLPT